MLSTASAVWGQSRDHEIVVTGNREQQTAIEDIPPERSVDEDAVAGYGERTVGEVIDDIAAENGDSGEPVLFVNGKPITDPGDIVDYPAEAIQRVDVLPRGAGARLGASPDKHAYNIVLKRVFKSDIGVLRDQLSTEGNWTAWGGEVFVSRISGQQRFNVTFRVRDEDELLESDRHLLQPTAVLPFDLTGNVVADPRFGAGEIDPVLSAAAGRLVTVAAVPAGSDRPSLAAFAAGAQAPNITDPGAYRTLKPDTRSYGIDVTGNRPLTDWLTAALTGRIEWTTYDSLQGLAAAVFVLPADNPYSPFTRPVGVARYLAGEPLRQRSSNLRGNLGLTLNATRGKWQINLRGDYRYFDWRTDSQRQQMATTLPILLAGPGGRSPYASDLADLVPLYFDSSFSRTQEQGVQASATGPVVNLPAGPLRANLNAGWRHLEQNSRTDNPFFLSRRSLARDELSAQASLEIPLTSRTAGVLGAVGDVSVTLDQGVTDVGSVGTARRQGYALNWQPIEPLRLQGAIERQRAVPDPGQLNDAATTTENVPYFDVLTGQTVEVTQVYGGNPALTGERRLTHRLSATAQLLRDNSLQLSAEYLSTKISDQISSLPPASTQLMAAFPDRFLRDATGRLIRVDLRPINFARRSTEQVRWGAVFSKSLAPAPPPGAPVKPGASRLRMQLTFSHVILLRDEVLARAGYPIVDLLNGGAIGFGGGSTRHQIDAGLNLNDREVGFRMNATWRSGSVLNAGSPAAPSRLHFSSLATVNVRAFADLAQLWPKKKWLKGTRLSLNLANVFDRRQRVVEETGLIPLRYQRGYRDPLGRTVEIELRKTF